MMTKVELFNAKNAGLKIEKDTRFTVSKIGQFQDTDKDGKEVTVTAMGTPTGEIYTSISQTVADSMDMLEDILADSETGQVDVKVLENVSNNGRKFFQLQILG
jgi:hypothetical protein